MAYRCLVQPSFETLLACQGSSNQKVARLFGCSVRTIIRWKQKYRIKDNPNYTKNKLSKWQVSRIRSLYATDQYTQQEIGKMFFVSQTTIGKIVNNVIHKTTLGLSGRSQTRMLPHVNT